MKITPVPLDQKQKDTWSGRTKLRTRTEEKHKTGRFVLKTAIGCRNKNKKGCFVLKIGLGCRNKNKNGCFVLFRLESTAYFGEMQEKCRRNAGEMPKEKEGNARR
ncbi:MAG: hypothetical protein J5382_11915 [Bacteroidales bacterium]|nr:hypothetical protein [Bacteroidales bacterium]